MEAIDTEREGPLTLKLYQDETPFDPRGNDNVGTMVCWHRRADLGDKTVNTESYDSYAELVEEFAGSDGIVLPLWLYEHSGMTIRTGDANPFHCEWDSGQVGFIFATRETISKEFSAPRYDCDAKDCGFYVWGDGGKARMVEHACEQHGVPRWVAGLAAESGNLGIEVPPDEMARECLEAEVEEYDRYLRGDVYGYVIRDEHGEHIDSCWGFFGYEYALQEARSQLTAHAGRITQERAQAQKHATLVDAGEFS